MRTDRYRYVEWKDKKGEIVACERYGHQTDPEENENVADKPEHAKVIAELGAQMKVIWKAAKP